MFSFFYIFLIFSTIIRTMAKRKARKLNKENIKKKCTENVHSIVKPCSVVLERINIFQLQSAKSSTLACDLKNTMPLSEKKILPKKAAGSFKQKVRLNICIHILYCIQYFFD